MTGAWGIFFIALSVALNGFFAGVETGFTSARRVRLEHWARRGRRGAALAARMAGNRENAIVGAVVGNNVAVVAGTSVATAFAVHHIPDSGETIAATVMAALNIVFGEILPKTAFRARPESMLVWSAWPFRVFSWLLWPLRQIAVGGSRGVLWLIGVRGAVREAPLTRDRLRRLFDSSRRSRHLDPVEDSLLSRFLHHSHRRLDRMFTPVDSVTRIPLSATARDLRVLVRDTGHSRIPVEDEAGRLAGLVVFRDLTLLDSDEPIVGVVRDIIRLSSMMALDEAIAALTARQASLGAVIGSDGNWLGIVTLEDLLEPLVGRIHDEHDTLPQVGPAA